VALRFHAWLGHKNIRYTVRYTVLSPTGSETSGTDRQSEIVAAINGPIAQFWLPKAKKFNDFSRAGVGVCVSGRGGHQFKPEAFAIDRKLRPMPFPGLASFGDDDADAALFYGRSREIAEILEALRKMRAAAERQPFMILGASGASKSSLRCKMSFLARNGRAEISRSHPKSSAIHKLPADYPSLPQRQTFIRVAGAFAQVGEFREFVAADAYGDIRG
jgi:hypothetical protein